VTTEHVVVTDADGIRTIGMNRPDKKNALTLAMYEAMTAAFEGANADGSVRCVLIAGVPGAFSAGNDLTDFLKAAESTGGLNRPALRFLSALVRCNKPMVAAVSGVAVGVGTTMLFHCDFVVAGSDALFNTVRQPRPDPGSGLEPAGAAPDGPSPRVRVAGHGAPT
jgi:enoyl-CoA hydratase/carnithine racemase